MNKTYIAKLLWNFNALLVRGPMGRIIQCEQDCIPCPTPQHIHTHTHFF